MTTAMTRLKPWATALCLLLCALVSCGTYEDKRIRELLNEKGFGARAQGDATRENYVGGRDRVQFLLEPDTLMQPGAERLGELTIPQPVAIDGTIFVPFVGPVVALGLTEAELGAVIRQQLRAVLKYDVPVQARIIDSGKVFYAFGEVQLKGRLPLEPDMTLIDAVVGVTRWTNLANLGRVYLIRPDAEHPLVVDVNLREMITSGLVQSNIQLRERDFVYIPPTFLGLLARLLERMFEPVGLAVRTLTGAAQAQASYQILTGQLDGANAFFFRF